MSNKPDYSFQDDAVYRISSKFKENPNAKTLLVIPTGGGKTRTAVKSILALFELGMFDDEKSRILWVAHRGELLLQASDAFNEESKHPYAKRARDCTIFESNVTASRTILDNDNIRLIIIDECHHAAASTYLPLFRPSVGVLGLTATPSRHDGKPLQFEGECFSIGFGELVERGIVLKPNIIPLEGIASEIRGFDDASLAKLNTSKRNGTIKEALIAGHELYKKVIVYVGTKKHAKDLYEMFRDSELSNYYDSISYVLGGDGSNSRRETRKVFFKKEKEFARSIIVNVQVLTEGYDDKSVNTVVMATPLNSKLTYFQCIGRAIRRNENDPQKKAFVLEITDKLPKIGYKIDNRWIYAEISDQLEPNILDLYYNDKDSLESNLASLYEEYSVPEKLRQMPEYEDSERYQILLFKKFQRELPLPHLPIILTNLNRQNVQGWFNYLSRGFGGAKGIPGNLHKVTNRDSILDAVKKWWGEDLTERNLRISILAAMENSGLHIIGDQSTASRLHPWITFVTLKKDLQPLNSKLDIFLDEVLNKDEIHNLITNLDNKDDYMVIKFPLPLSGFVARIASREQWLMIEKTLDDIQNLAKIPQQSQAEDLRKVLMQTRFPFEISLLESLPCMAKEPNQYIYQFN